jgi:hypothetical protein
VEGFFDFSVIIVVFVGTDISGITQGGVAVALRKCNAMSGNAVAF